MKCTFNIFIKLLILNIVLIGCNDAIQSKKMPKNIKPGRIVISLGPEIIDEKDGIAGGQNWDGAIRPYYNGELIYDIDLIYGTFSTYLKIKPDVESVLELKGKISKNLYLFLKKDEFETASKNLIVIEPSDFSNNSYKLVITPEILEKINY